MNKLLIVSAFLLSASTAQAGGYLLISSDNSELSGLCIAAVESRGDLLERAQSIGMDAADLAELRCNGKALPVFLSTFRTIEDNRVVTYIFSKNDDSDLTELCYTAVRSEQEYEQVKDAYFSAEQNIEQEVLCNGMPLKNFARKYRNRTFTASTR